MHSTLLTLHFPTVRLFAFAMSWIEGEALRQLYATSKLEGVRLAVGFPDLHPGKGGPGGAAFVTRQITAMEESDSTGLMLARERPPRDFQLQGVSF